MFTNVFLTEGAFNEVSILNRDCSSLHLGSVRPSSNLGGRRVVLNDAHRPIHF